jgi:hypothetical protein
MTEDIYRKVQRQLDQYSIGFPETESGVEIEIPKFLFSKEQAELFNQITGEPETPELIARRLERSVEELSEELETI